MRTPEILMVDDNPADIDLTREVLARSKGHFHVNAVTDGAEAISFLRRQGKYTEAPAPDLVVLDLNLPRKDGCEVFSNIKADPALAKIPVVIFTTSQASSGGVLAALRHFTA
jgi:two-component system, chemotaxis family, response regulator Rcp1